MYVDGRTGGAVAALTTSESYVDLSAFAGKSVWLWCSDGDFWFSFSAAGDATSTLITTATTAASTTALVAERLAAGFKGPRRITSLNPTLIAKMVSGTGTLKVKLASDNGERVQPHPEMSTSVTSSATVSGTVTATQASGQEWSLGKQLALGASYVVKASAGTLRSLNVRLDSTAASGTYYVLLHNTTSVPADAQVPFASLAKIIHVAGADDRLSVDFGEFGVALSTGITLVLSTTEATKTIAGSYLGVHGVEYK